MNRRIKQPCFSQGIATRSKLQRFTLIELLVCIAIIGILASMLLPSLMRAKYTAKLVVCLGNQKQVGVGVTMYADDNNERYPSPTANVSGSSVYPVDGQLVRGVVRSVTQIMDEDHMDYYGGWGGAKGIFMCPLIEPEYASRINNYKTKFPYHLSQVPFALFFNYGGPSITTPWIEKPMVKTGDTWKIRKRGGTWQIQYNSSEKESDILIGDYLGRRNWSENGFAMDTMYVNHNDWGKPIIDVKAHGDGSYANYYTYAPTSGNFLLNDLSGATYRDLHWSYRKDITGGFLGYTGDSQGGIVPLELLRDP